MMWLAAHRELSGSLVIQRRTRRLLGVPVPVPLAEHFSFQHGCKGFTVEELVPEPGC